MEFASGPKLNQAYLSNIKRASNDGEYHIFQVRMDDDNAKFYIDGNLTNTISSSLPDSAGARISPFSGVWKQSGTSVNVRVDIDFFELYNLVDRT